MIKTSNLTHFLETKILRLGVEDLRVAATVDLPRIREPLADFPGTRMVQHISFDINRFNHRTGKGICNRWEGRRSLAVSNLWDRWRDILIIRSGFIVTWPMSFELILKQSYCCVWLLHQRGYGNSGIAAGSPWPGPLCLFPLAASKVE